MVAQPHQSASSRDTIAEIGQYLATELEAVEEILRSIVESDSQLIRDVSDYICLANGKKLRPMLNLLTARAFNPGGETFVEVAASMELVHVATLLHDDVIDKAPMRRGKASVNARWGEDVAILMADYLYSSAFDLLLRHVTPQPLQLICKVTRRMCEGEMFQIERRGTWLTPDDYLRICTCKTGWLFSACTALAGDLAGLGADTVARLAAFGMDFGIAFQITDDTLDYTAVDELWGKSVGIDLAAGKQTLPLILTLQSADPDERRRLGQLVREGNGRAEVLEALRRHRAIDRSLELAQTYTQQSLAHLDGIAVGDPSAYEYLTALPDYVARRSY
jgi:octaprenyl-diphosphate synthase